MLNDEIKFLKEKAAFIRKRICIASNKIGVIHLGGLLSATDIVVALYYKYLRFSLDKIEDPNRNKFVLSKGHCGILLYSVLADLGLYDWNDIMDKFKVLSHQLWQHENYRLGIEVATGSLGHGLSIATGMALANRDNNICSRIYCLVGDGEMHEGTNWEAIMFAGSQHLSNLVCLVDFNQCSSSFRYGDGITFDWLKAFTAFGWKAILIDGESMFEIVGALETLSEVIFSDSSKPTAIIAKTHKGHCIDFLQGTEWHVGSLGDELLPKALECIDLNLRLGSGLNENI